MATGDENFSYLIPDGIGARIAHADAAIGLLAAMMDAVLAHDPCGERVLFELSQGPPRKRFAVFVFRRDGGNGTPSAEDREELARRAHEIRADVEIITNAPTSVTAVVAIPLRGRN